MVGMRVVRRLGLTWQLLLPSTAAIILAVGLFQLWTLAVTAQEVERGIDQNLETAMALLKTSLLPFGNKWSIEGDQLRLGTTVIDGDLAVLDQVSRLLHGGATIFAGDRRVATTLRNADGQRLVGTHLQSEEVRKTVLQQGNTFRGPLKIFNVDYFAEYEPIRNPRGDVIGMLFVATLLSGLTALQSRLIFEGLLIGAALVVVLSLLRAWLLVRTLRPINALTAVMMRVAGGDLELEVPGLERTDQIGQFALAVNIWKDATRDKQLLELEAEEQHRLAEEERQRNDAIRAEVVAEQARVVAALGDGLGRLAGGDLTFRINEPFSDRYDGLRSDFNNAMEQLLDIMLSVTAVTDTLRSGNGEIASAADDLSKRTEQQAASLEQTAAALDQITATVQRTAHGAKRAHTLVSHMRADAERSGKVLSETVAAIGNIEKSSQQITQIIGVIDEIAFQTSLLALNAAVEAARAGDSGRGFAIVAAEVRALAQRSAEAAREIKTLISTATRQVDTGVRLVGETGNALAGILANVGEVSTVVSEIAAAADEQATGLSEVNNAVNAMDQVTQRNAAMVEESNSACQSLAAETEELVRLTGRFRLASQPTFHDVACE